LKSLVLAEEKLKGTSNNDCFSMRSATIADW
jgi:hypothetical protein